MMLQFYALVLEHFAVYGALVLGLLIGLWLLLRKRVFSVFDPLFFYLVVTETFCIADVLMLYGYGAIEPRYFVNYLLTEGALFVGFLQFKVVEPTPAARDGAPVPTSLRLAAVVATLLFLGLNVLVYLLRGIPLLMESRLETYSVGGGWGVIARLLDVLPVIILYYLLEVRERRRWGLAEWATAAAVVAAQILSGAKSAVLTVVFVVALHAHVTGALRRPGAAVGRVLRYLAVAAVAGFIAVAAVQKSDLAVAGIEVPVLGQAALRFIANGDAFVYSYPNGFIEELDGSQPLAALAKEYLAFFRLADPDRLPGHLGVQISGALVGGDAMTQTNAKHNLVGYVYFGMFGSILFSYLVGTCIGAARFKLVRLASGQWIWGVTYILVNVAFAAAGSEWDSVSRAVINVITFIVPTALVLAAFERQAEPSPDAPATGP